MLIAIFLCIAALMLVVVKLVTGVAVRDTARATFGQLACRTLGHRRMRTRVIRVGENYTSRCGRCGIRLERHGKDGDWRPAVAPDAAGTIPVTAAMPGANE